MWLGCHSTSGDPAADAEPGQWSVVSGPGEVQFINPTQRFTRATLPAPGVCVLRFASAEGGAPAADELTVEQSAHTKLFAATDENNGKAASMPLSGFTETITIAAPCGSQAWRPMAPPFPSGPRC